MVNVQPLNVLTFATCSLTLVLNHRVRTEDTEDDETVNNYGESQVTLVNDIYGFKKLLFTDYVPDNVLQIKSMQKFKSAKKLSPNLGFFAEMFLLTMFVVFDARCYYIAFFQLGKRLILYLAMIGNSLKQL